ncbi:MAG: hypothetical protein S0880_10365 [Actinomycetota bacterium]|nr:hypothetical protein [Actinomycetota bacterium]
MISSGYWPRIDDPEPGVHVLVDPINGHEYRAVIPRLSSRWPFQWEGPTRRGAGGQARAFADLRAELDLRQWLTNRRQETPT